jgi:ankyrin repeat protein
MRFAAVLLCAIACGCAKPRDKELIDAIDAGNSALVDKLLEKGANPQARDREVTSLDALELAARNGSVPMVKSLLAHGAHYGTTDALNIAASHGHVEMARMLLAAGAPADAPHGKQKALSFAMTDCSMPMVDLLLGAGADINGAVDPGLGYPPLVIAAEEGQIACVRRMLEAGADIEHRDALGFTALAQAVVKDRREVVKLLLERGADPLAPNRAGHTPAFIAGFRGDRDEIEAILEDAGVTDYSMKIPPKLEGGGPLIEVPVINVHAP